MSQLNADELKTQATEDATKKAQALKSILDNTNEIAHASSGAAGFKLNAYKNYSKIDRFDNRLITPNSVYKGLTFITRPKLCLMSSNLRTSRILTLLDTDDPDSVQFLIRHLLDSKLARAYPYYVALADSSKLVDVRNPFLTPVMNNLTDISGFPSQNIESFTNEGGFFSEDQRIAMGSDRNRKSFDLNLSFTDPQGGIVMTLMQMWLEYITLVTAGECVAYAEDIDNQRLNYTVSIYRFLLDPSRQYIAGWARAAGCYPVSRPGGAKFDLNRAETFVEAAKNFSITFAANFFTENDPADLQDFNRLVRKYNPNIEDDKLFKTAPISAEYNYLGIPYVVFSRGRAPRLAFRYNAYELPKDDLSKINNDVQSLRPTSQTNINNQITLIG